MFLAALPMLNCLQGQQESVTPQGSTSSEDPQSLVTPGSTLAVALVSSLPPQSIPNLAPFFFYDIDDSSAMLAILDFECMFLSTKAQAIVDHHIIIMARVISTPCLETSVVEPTVDQPFVALNEDLLSSQTASQLQKEYFLHCSFASTSHLTEAVALVDTGATSNFISKDMIDKLVLEYNPVSFSITNHAFVAEFTVAKYLTCPVILGVEWWLDHNTTPIPKDNLLRITHPARIYLGVLMILFLKEAPHILVSSQVTITHTVSFDVLLPCLLHLHAAFDSKPSDVLPAHSQFEFELKPTVDPIKATSPIYPLNLKEEQCREEWTDVMEAKKILSSMLFTAVFPEA
ncbi:hypothetical protein DSO57_1011268 [Entomophthora muscae]|uniref:Uncharacterized protein n=1 Tax=Entomophthora muscae TaxID=34485 RepID=A0ACC2TU27_9FUNG|nr:hypothetical protein DSO57_1011268 [Entomophthora muscae]